MKLLITYDATAKAVYVYLQPHRKDKNGVVAESKRIDMNTMLDYDSTRDAFGIEILNVDELKVEDGRQFHVRLGLTDKERNRLLS